MGDENPIRTLRDYSKPSHEGYKNTIELPVGNNVVPLRSDTIRLVQNECSFHGLRFEDPNQHLKDFLKLVDSLDLDSDNSERTRLRLFQFSLRDQASNWLERLPAGSITTWKDLTTPQYEDEGWNDAFIPDENDPEIHKYPNIEQLLGIMERKVDTFMKDVISLMGRSESVFRMTTNEMYRPPSEPSRQEEFEHIVMNFILNNEQKTQEHKRTILHLSRDFIGRKDSKIQSEFLAYQNLDQAFFDSISIDPFSWPQWGNLLCMIRNTYVLSLDWEASQGKCLFLELGWRVELYTKRKSRDNATLSGLSRAKTVKESHLLMEFWPSIGDGGFNVGNTKVASIRNPRVKLAHRCIATTIAGRKETTHRVTEIDLYYLYSVEEVEEAEEEAEGEAVNEGASGFAKMYQKRDMEIGKVRKHNGMEPN
ncbi:hypothetical protein Tco_0961937 [Tanacetum coccineum]